MSLIEECGMCYGAGQLPGLHDEGGMRQCHICKGTGNVPERPDWDTYWLRMLPGVKARASCPRRQVGAIIVDSGNRILSTGYNGPPSGMPNCTEQPCEGAYVEKGPTELCIALHAEHNAIYFAGDNIMRAETLYCTTQPCVRCALEILQTPISKVVFLEDYPSDAGAKLLRQGGRSIWQMKMRLDLNI